MFPTNFITLFNYFVCSVVLTRCLFFFPLLSSCFFSIFFPYLKVRYSELQTNVIFFYVISDNVFFSLIIIMMHFFFSHSLSLSLSFSLSLSLSWSFCLRVFVSVMIVNDSWWIIRQPINCLRYCNGPGYVMHNSGVGEKHWVCSHHHHHHHHHHKKNNQKTHFNLQSLLSFLGSHLIM